MVYAVVVERRGSVVLSEGVVAEHDAFAVHVGEHGVGPVQHGHFNKGECGVAQAEGIACLHKVPVLVIVSADDGFALLGAIYRCAGNLAHQLGKRTTMVNLVVVHDDVVYLLEVYLLFQSTDKLFVVGLPDSVDERHFLVADEI